MRLAICAFALWLAVPAHSAAQEGAAQEGAAQEGAPSADSARETGSAAQGHLSEGQRLYSELDFMGAIASLQRALASPGLLPRLEVEALEYLGASYVVLEQDARATEAFQRMFSVDPYWIISEPSGSPKIARFVERVRRERVPDAAIEPGARLRLELPTTVYAGETIPVSVIVSGTTNVTQVRIGLRGVGEAEFAPIPAEPTGPGAFRAVLPAPRAEGQLDLFGEARNRAGQLVTRGGAPLSPLSISVLPRVGGRDEDGGLLSEWWFWTTVGVVLIASAVAIALVSTAASAPEGSLATIPLP